jgi:hypothetical protein
MKKLVAAVMSAVMVFGPMSMEASAASKKKTKRTKVIRVNRKIRNGSSCKRPGAIYVDSRGRKFKCVAAKRKR